MNHHDDSDLAGAFAHLTAPRSSANYADRTLRSEVTPTGRSWMRIGGAAAAVVLTLGGAVAFVGLRNARHNPASTAASLPYPPARSGAAMAYDTTIGRTIMYGGNDGTGRALSDTWSWDGSSWSPFPGIGTGTSPGALIGVHLGDDPPDGGVLLVGTRVRLGDGVTATGCAMPGAVVGTGTTAPVPPPPALPVCPAIAVAPTLETWILTARGWNQLAGGSGATSRTGPPANLSSLGFDASTGEVVAIQSPLPGFRCGPPIAPLGAPSPAMACPVMGAGAAPDHPPGAAPTLPAPGTVLTWTWSHGRWVGRGDAGGPRGVSEALLFAGPGDQHAQMLAGGSDCFGGVSAKCAAPMATLWSWSTTGWQQAETAPDLIDLTADGNGGGLIARVAGQTLLVLNDGDKFAASSGIWTQLSSSSGPSPRFGSTLAPGPTGVLVLFGGLSSRAVIGQAVSSSGLGPGSDTWTWQAGHWTHVAGAAPPQPALPSPPGLPVPQTAPPACASGTPAPNGCPVPQPAPVTPPPPSTASPLGASAVPGTAVP